MKEENAIAKQIKKYIKYRNKTLHETADVMGIGYTTFCEQLNRGTLRAETLFRLADYLDIDLNLMMQSLSSPGHLSLFEGDAVPRMSKAHRENELDQVMHMLDYLIHQTLGKTGEIKRELLKAFNGNFFYLLDVLTPENADILLFSERGKEKIKVYTSGRSGESCSFMGSRPVFRKMLSADDELNRIIEERKEKLL